MLTLDDIAVRLFSYGPSTTLKIDGKRIEVDPDLFIALEGIGTVKGVTIEERVSEFLRKGKDLEKTSYRMHWESTRRGHASLTTSLILQFEVERCSRVASMLLVSPPFASYLQESQRRRRVEPGEFFIPRGIEADETAEKPYLETVRRLYESYLWLIGEGVELEDARYVLPLSSKTSVFATGSLETFIGFMLKNEDEYYPKELAELGRIIEKLSEKVAPNLTRARLAFQNPLPSYPYANPYKPRDKLMELLTKNFGEPLEPRLINFKAILPEDLASEDLLNNPDIAATLNPLIETVFLESLSLAAYHQSIRHRTVPTAVESIYQAAERALRDSRRWVVEPPKVKASEKLSRRFHESVAEALNTYQQLLENGVKPSDAVYLLPQALRIYVARAYNAFNLLWPQGYVGTRSCSYAQWEERMTAYAIWKAVEERSPSLAQLMGEKCKLLGYCPEREWCPIILKYHSYGDEEHRRRNQQA